MSTRSGRPTFVCRRTVRPETRACRSPPRARRRDAGPRRVAVRQRTAADRTGDNRQIGGTLGRLLFLVDKSVTDSRLSHQVSRAGRIGFDLAAELAEVNAEVLVFFD